MLNATNVGIGELRSTIEEAMCIRTSLHQRTILFLDEIHRFNKSQQDVLLPSVESGQIILIGATTENPFFEVNRPLLSRLRLLTLERLDATALVAILRRALTDEEYGLGKKALIVTDDLLEDIGRFVDGDARMALNILEQVGAMVRSGGEITVEIIEKVLGNAYGTMNRLNEKQKSLCLTKVSTLSDNHTGRKEFITTYNLLEGTYSVVACIQTEMTLATYDPHDFDVKEFIKWNIEDTFNFGDHEFELDACRREYPRHHYYLFLAAIDRHELELLRQGIRETCGPVDTID